MKFLIALLNLWLMLSSAFAGTSIENNIYQPTFTISKSIANDNTKLVSIFVFNSYPETSNTLIGCNKILQTRSFKQQITIVVNDIVDKDAIIEIEETKCTISKN